MVVRKSSHGLPLLASCQGINQPPNSSIKLIVPVENLSQALGQVNPLGGTIGQIAFNTTNFLAQDGIDPEGNELQLRASIKKV
jgi:predicted enzyme related to lactoylglutathione lyase